MKKKLSYDIPACLREGSFLSGKWMALWTIVLFMVVLEVTGQGHTLDPLCIHGTIISQVDYREAEPQQETGTAGGSPVGRVFVLATEHEVSLNLGCRC